MTWLQYQAIKPIVDRQTIAQTFARSQSSKSVIRVPKFLLRRRFSLSVSPNSDILQKMNILVNSKILVVISKKDNITIAHRRGVGTDKERERLIESQSAPPKSRRSVQSKMAPRKNRLKFSIRSSTSLLNRGPSLSNRGSLASWLGVDMLQDLAGNWDADSWILNTEILVLCSWDLACMGGIPLSEHLIGFRLVGAD